MTLRLSPPLQTRSCRRSKAFAAAPHRGAREAGGRGGKAPGAGGGWWARVGGGPAQGRVWRRRIGSFAIPLTILPVFMHRSGAIANTAFEVTEAVAIGFAILAFML